MRGAAPPAFDKQPFRDWLATLDWDRTPPPPHVPGDVVAVDVAALRRCLRARHRTCARRLVRSRRREVRRARRGDAPRRHRGPRGRDDRARAPRAGVHRRPRRPCGAIVPALGRRRRRGGGAGPRPVARGSAARRTPSSSGRPSSSWPADGDARRGRGLPRHQLRVRRAHGVPAARRGHALRLAPRGRPARPRRDRAARRLRARRLPATRGDRAVLRRHGCGCARSRRPVARCSGSATGSRSCARQGCCPARSRRTGG